MALGSLSLDQLRVLVTIADLGSFSAAARKLRRAQSAISQAVATLEALQGVRLFDRSGLVRRNLRQSRAHAWLSSGRCWVVAWTSLSRNPWRVCYFAGRKHPVEGRDGMARRLGMGSQLRRAPGSKDDTFVIISPAVRSFCEEYDRHIDEPDRHFRPKHLARAAVGCSGCRGSVQL